MSGQDQLERGMERGDLAVLLGLWRFVKPRIGQLALALALLPAITATAVSQTYMMKQALDVAIVPASPTHTIGQVLAVFLALLMLEALLRFAHGYLLQSVGMRVVHDLRVALVEHLERAPMPYFDENPVGRLLTRATSDMEAIGELFSSGAIASVGDAITVAGVVMMMFWLDARLAGVVLLAAPGLLLAVAFFRKRMKADYETARARMARMTAYLAEALAGSEVLKVTAQEPRAASEYAAINGGYRDAYWWSNFHEAALYAAVEMTGNLTVAGLLWTAGGGLATGHTTFGTLVAFLRLVEDLFTPLRDSSAKFAVLQSATVAADRILAVLAVTPEDVNVHAAASSPGAQPVRPERGAIAFEDVTFAYRDGPPVLDRVSFTIRPGERIAIVGATGAGKTTLVKLLCRLYAVRAGRIVLDGSPLTDWPLGELRRRVAYMPQDCYLFSGTVHENVSLSKPGFDRAAVEEAARRAGADGAIRALPGGFGLLLTERGLNLSAGERQLVAFARVCLLDPSVLVLDEATASVDTFAEEAVQRSLERIVEGRTTIIIAHRLATVRSVDRILVFDAGKLAEEGRHGELLARGGLYARLYRLQYDRVSDMSAQAGIAFGR